MTTPLLPDYELLGWIIATLRADSELNGLVFSLTPQIDALLDKRIFSAYVDLPAAPAIRSAFPRVTVEALGTRALYQQDDAVQPQGAVNVWTYTTVPKKYEQLAEQIDARIAYILVSTPVTSLRIIASRLVPIGQRRPSREPALDDAWRITSQYRADLVGVL